MKVRLYMISTIYSTIYKVGQNRIRIIIRIIRYGMYAVSEFRISVYTYLYDVYTAIHGVFPYIRRILAVFFWAILSHNRFGVGWSQLLSKKLQMGWRGWYAS
jgi:hypothetical protein